MSRSRIQKELKISEYYMGKSIVRNPEEDGQNLMWCPFIQSSIEDAKASQLVW